ARYASLVMAGKSLPEVARMSGRLLEEVTPHHFSVKESVFPFNKFPGVDIILGPEMRSTGEVMGIDDTFPMAFANSQLAPNRPVRGRGSACGSVAARDKAELVPVARNLAALGYQLGCTRGKAMTLRTAKIGVKELNKLKEGRPNLLDALKNKEIALVINTPSG